LLKVHGGSHSATPSGPANCGNGVTSSLAVMRAKGHPSTLVGGSRLVSGMSGSRHEQKPLLPRPSGRSEVLPPPAHNHFTVICRKLTTKERRPPCKVDLPVR